MSERKLIAEFELDFWQLWYRTPGSETDSGYSCTAHDPVTGSESDRPINQSDMDDLPQLGEPLLPATWWFLLADGTAPQKLNKLARRRPEMIKNVNSQVSLRDIINVSADHTTPLLEVIEINRHSVVPELLKIGASPTTEILVQATPPIWTTAFVEALKADRIRILRHFVETGLLRPEHLRECQEKYTADRLDLPEAEAEHVNLLLEAINARLERGEELSNVRDSPSSGRRPKVR